MAVYVCLWGLSIVQSAVSIMSFSITGDYYLGSPFALKIAPVKGKRDAVDFEKSLRELEALVARMEGGDLSLEQSLKDFERGITLTRLCQRALADAEQKVKVLVDRGGEAELQPLSPQEDNNEQR